jgi:hypothetical protein
MASSPIVRISKYFGAASIQKEEVSLAEAKGALQYFWTQEGSKNIIISVDGQQLSTYDELVALASTDKYVKKAYLDVGLYLSNEGTSSIWPKRS